MSNIYKKTEKQKLPPTDSFGNRLVFSLRVYVSRDGKYIHSETQRLTIYGNADEEPYVLINKRKYNVATLVSICYVPEPKDGKKYVLVHKDGNLQNCDKSNLEWQLCVYKFNSQPTTHLANNNVSLTVTNSGEVLQGNQKLQQLDYLYDSDTDSHACIRPHVKINGKRYFIEDLVDAARYVHGDKYSMTDPVILHKDHDRNNFNSDNLEWVESTDSKYIAYKQDEDVQIQKRRIELNPGKPLP